MNKDSKKKWRTYGMNTTRRDESKKKFYAEVKDILEKKHRESSWYMMELMGVEGRKKQTVKRHSAL